MSKDIELPAEESTEGMENLRLWRSVEKTPPDMTKDVKFGKRHYTTIDPQWQMRVATALWGPYGMRWGLRNMSYQMVEQHDGDENGRFMTSVVILRADFFYPCNGKQVSFEILNDDRFRAGDDTLKKLVTNTRSKALSWLGFSADVFMGKFDDTAYVKDLKIKFGEQNEFVEGAAVKIRTAKDMAALKVCEDRLDDLIAHGTLNDPEAAQELRELVAERKRELGMDDLLNLGR